MSDSEFSSSEPDFGELPGDEIFEQLLVEATHAPNRAIKAGVRRIGLGAFADRSMGILRLSQDQLEAVEMAEIVFIHADKSVSISEEPIYGAKTNVVIPTPKDLGIIRNPLADILPRQYRQNKFLGTVMHVHPVEYPFSPVDIGGLLLEDDSLQATTAEFIMTPQQRMLLFRGQKSPSFSQEDVDEIVEAFTKSLRDGYRIFAENKLHWSYAARLNAQLLGFVMRGNDLQLYTGPITSNVVTHVPAENLII